MSENVYVAYVNQYYIKLWHENVELLKAIHHFIYIPDDLKVYEKQPTLSTSYPPFQMISEDLLMITSKKNFALQVYYYKRVDGKWRVTKKVIVHPIISEEEDIMRRVRDFNYRETNDYSYLKFVKR